MASPRAAAASYCCGKLLYILFAAAARPDSHDGIRVGGAVPCTTGRSLAWNCWIRWSIKLRHVLLGISVEMTAFSIGTSAKDAAISLQIRSTAYKMLMNRGVAPSCLFWAVDLLHCRVHRRVCRASCNSSAWSTSHQRPPWPYRS